MKNILDILYDYSINKKLLDEEAVLKIIKQFIDIYNIDTINQITINERDIKHFFSSILGYKKGGKLCIFLKKIYVSMNKMTVNKFKDSLSYYLRYNLFILQIVIHEVEHAIQEMITNSNKTDIESKLLKIEKSFVDELIAIKEDNHKEYKKKLKLYYKNYDIAFSERMAQINSYKKILEIIEPIKKQIEELFNLQEIYYNGSKIVTYKSINDNPTVSFFSNLGMIKQLNDLNYNNFGFEERLNFGFKLSEHEFKFARQLKRRS